MLIRICALLLLSASALVAQQQPVVQPFQDNMISQLINVRDFTISSNGQEAYFSAQSPLGDISAIMVINNVNGTWSQPELVSFSGKFMDLEPFLSIDGLSLYFASDRPLNNMDSEPKDFDLWLAQRTNLSETWSTPINISPLINSEYNEFYPSVSQNKNLYFTSDRPDSKGKDDIFLSEWVDSAYTIPVSIADSINTDGYEFNAYVSPDESFIIFTGYNRMDGLGSGDMYISYRSADLEWGTAINLGPEINSLHMDYCPYVHFDSKQLYFTSRRSNLKTPADGFQSAESFLKEVNSYENGLSRIYSIDFSQFMIKSAK